MAAFDPNGFGHICLNHLSCGPATRDDLVKVAFEAGKPESKVKHVLAAMQRTGLIRYMTGYYTLTGAGIAALARLEAGEVVVAVEAVAPNARVFA